VTLTSPSAAGEGGAGSVRGRAVRLMRADWVISSWQRALIWSFQAMQSRLPGPRRAVSCPVWTQW
jgi:hypothetical protein